MRENVDEKDKKRTEITVRWAVHKLAEEEAAERAWSVTESPTGTPRRLESGKADKG